jgi:hypothetical protein
MKSIKFDIHYRDFDVSIWGVNSDFIYNRIAENDEFRKDLIGQMIYTGCIIECEKNTKHMLGRYNHSLINHFLPQPYDTDIHFQDETVFLNFYSKKEYFLDLQDVNGHWTLPHDTGAFVILGQVQSEFEGRILTADPLTYIKPKPVDLILTGDACLAVFLKANSIYRRPAKYQHG